MRSVAWWRAVAAFLAATSASARPRALRLAGGSTPSTMEELADEPAARRWLAAGPAHAVSVLVFGMGAAAMDMKTADKARAAGAARVARVDATSEEGEECALAFNAADLPWVAVARGGAVTGSAPAGVAKAVAEALPKAADVDVRASVRAAYAATATGGPSVLPGDVGDVATRRAKLGYGDDVRLEEGADLGLGCGNPLQAAKLRPGEVVLDLGSGAGVDCFAAAAVVGPAGRVLGVDMTPEMLARARATARAKAEYAVVDFRLGEIEHLPVGDGVVDCVISNCVINLSPDKPAVYREMNRVLRPGGRVSISDVLRTADIPDALRTSEAYACWVAGASAEDEIRDMLVAAGFSDISIEVKENGRDIVKDWIPGSGAEKYVTSAYVTATKPRAAHGFRDAVVYDLAGAPCCGPPPAAAESCCPPPAPPASGGVAAGGPPSSGAKPAAWG